MTEGDQRNREINQYNLRAERHLSVVDLGTLDAGVSLQRGQTFSSITRKRGEKHAVARRANATFGSWNLRLHGIRYEFDRENPAGVDAGFMQTGGFDFPFLMAARATVCTANGARNFGASPGLINGGTCYNDFTFIAPKVDNSADSLQNATVCPQWPPRRVCLFRLNHRREHVVRRRRRHRPQRGHGGQMALSTERQQRVLLLKIHGENKF